MLHHVILATSQCRTLCHPSIVPSCTQHQNTEIFHTKIHTVSWICVMLIEFDGKFDHPSQKPNKTTKKNFTTFSTFSRIPPPFFEVLKSSPFPFRKGNPRHRANDSVGNFPPKVLHPPSLPPNELFAFPTFFQKVASCCLGCFFYSKVGVSRVFHLHSFSDVGMFFFSKVGVSWGRNQNLHVFFRCLGVLLFKMGGFSIVFHHLDFLKKTLETFHPNAKYFQGFKIKDCRSPWSMPFPP